MVFEIYNKRYTYLGKGAIVQGENMLIQHLVSHLKAVTAISNVFTPLLVLVSNSL